MIGDEFQRLVCEARSRVLLLLFFFLIHIHTLLCACNFRKDVSETVNSLGCCANPVRMKPVILPHPLSRRERMMLPVALPRGFPESVGNNHKPLTKTLL